MHHRRLRPARTYVRDLPPLAQAAPSSTTARRTPYSPTAQPLTHWIDTLGYRPAGHPREINVECPGNHDAWVTELRTPVTAEPSPAGETQPGRRLRPS